MGACHSCTSSKGSKPGKDIVILVIGLDNSGKTTLTHTIKGGAPRRGPR
jgi:GTPase SAR1 family protein